MLNWRQNEENHVIKEVQSLGNKKSTQHGDRSPPRGLAAHLHPHHRSEDPKGTQQKPLLKHTPREIPTASATLAPHDVAKWEASLLLWPGPTNARMCSFHWTTDLRSHNQALALRPINSGCALSAAEPVPEQLHLCEQHLGTLSQCSATERPMWCPQRAGRLRTMGDRQR